MDEQNRLQKILEYNSAKFSQMKVVASKIFMGFILILGFINFIIAWNTDKDLQNKPCASNNMKNANKILLCISTAMVITPILYFFGDCNNPESVHYKWYLYLALILGILTIFLGAIISSESKKDECHIESHPEWIWILGTITTLLSGFLIYYVSKKM
jgi:cytochrome bd-type quinol oxidase subunit 2